MLLRRGVLPQGAYRPICFAHTCCLTDLITGRNTHIMRARFVRSRGRATTRGRYFVPLSATAVVALAAGTLVAVNPISDGDNVALTQSTASSFEAGAGANGAAETNGTVGQAVSIPLQSLFDVSGQYSWILEASEISVTGLPEGLNFNEETKTIEGTPTKNGSFTIVVTAGDQTAEADISIGTEGDGTVATGSLGSDNPLSGAVTAVLGSLGLSGEAAANSTGNAGGEVPGDENPDTTGSLIDVEGNGNTEGTTGSLPIDVQALIEGATGSTGDVETPETPTEGEIDGEGTGEVAIQSSGSTVPGGSISDFVPFLTISGALLLGLAAAGALGAGSSAPGMAVNLGSNGSTTNGGNDTGSTGSTTGNAKKPAPKTEAPKAPGPEVNNGRG